MAEPVAPADAVGAFVGRPRLLSRGAPGGPLAGTTLAVKDLFDVAGTVTGAGNPDFAAGRAPATVDAPAVAALVRAGASVVGKTVTDELAYSLAGTNVHFGTPRNVAAPGHIPGGSSSGSAAAVAAGLVDLALGTDTGGSIRVPASYCGTFGWRPTHGRVPIAGVVPLAPSFDTVGLLARDPALLATAAFALAPEADAILDVDVDEDASAAPRLLVVAEALTGLADEVRADLLAALPGAAGPATAIGVDLDAAAAAFRSLQGAEAWQAHGAWITATTPRFGPDIAARFRAAQAVTADQVAAAGPVRAAVTAAVRATTADGTVLVLPATPGPAPRLDADPAAGDATRAGTLRLTCLAGLAGAPVVVAPLLRVGGRPMGLAFLAAPGSDHRLLAWVARTFGPPPAATG